MSLNSLALVNTISQMRGATLRRPALAQAVSDAQIALQKNEEFIRNCKEKLADHTRELKWPEIVAVNDTLAAVIPIPDGGSVCVEPIFVRLTKL